MNRCLQEPIQRITFLLLFLCISQIILVYYSVFINGKQNNTNYLNLFYHFLDLFCQQNIMKIID